MGIYDRDYVRNDVRGDGLFADSPVTKYLILANVIVYLLQLFVVRTPTPADVMHRLDIILERMADERGVDARDIRRQLDENEVQRLVQQIRQGIGQVNVVDQWFDLETTKVLQGQVWRLITYGFCHDRSNLWHILFNMLLLYWFGRELETIYGPREFLVFYLTGIAAAGAAHIALDLATGWRIPAIGASGGVMAVMMLYTWLYPRNIIYLFWVVPVELRFAMVFYLIYDLHPVLLALTERGGQDGIAHAAHLGGLIFGFCYAKFDWRLSSFGDRFVPRTRRRFGSRPKLRIAPETVPEPDPENDRVDAILQKIMEHGRSSLTDEERQVLIRASERIRKEQGDPLDD